MLPQHRIQGLIRIQRHAFRTLSGVDPKSVHAALVGSVEGKSTRALLARGAEDKPTHEAVGIVEAVHLGAVSASLQSRQPSRLGSDQAAAMAGGASPLPARALDPVIHGYGDRDEHRYPDDDGEVARRGIGYYVRDILGRWES